MGSLLERAVPENAPSLKDEILSGMRMAVPVVVSSAPFSVLFGALAVDNGFTVLEAIFASAIIFAGASQMVGLELFGQNVAPWLIVLSIFAVNFRHVLYSATIGRGLSGWPLWQQAIGYFFLTDPQFAESERKVEKGVPITFAWYLSLGLTIYLFWLAETGVGAVFGRMMPDTHALGLDFLLPIYFLGMVMSFRSRAGWLPIVVVSGIVSMVAYRTIGSPWHVTVGALAGVLLGAIILPGAEKASEP